MSFEEFDSKSEFLNPVFADMAGENLMPKIRFTTDKAEAEEAAKADRSNPFDLPDTVVYVEPKDTTGEERSEAEFRGGSFLNPSFGIEITPLDMKAAEAEAGSEYSGPSADSISLKLENDAKDLAFAQEQLAIAIERGTGVMQAMRNVESAQAVLDAHMKLYNEAIKFRPPEVPVAAKADTAKTGEAKLGSVSHAQWKLEQAYKNDNKIAIENAKRELAHEKAKEEAKK